MLRLGLPVFIIAVSVGLFSFGGIAGTVASIIRFLFMWFIGALALGLFVAKRVLS